MKTQYKPGEILGTLAQLVEQRTFNPFVVGSTPAGPTNSINGLAARLGHFFWQDGAPPGPKARIVQQSFLRAGVAIQVGQ